MVQFLQYVFHVEAGSDQLEGFPFRAIVHAERVPSGRQAAIERPITRMPGKSVGSGTRMKTGSFDALFHHQETKQVPRIGAVE